MMMMMMMIIIIIIINILLLPSIISYYHHHLEVEQVGRRELDRSMLDTASAATSAGRRGGALRVAPVASTCALTIT